MLINEIKVPDDFFSVGSLATLAGATGTVYVICGGIQRAFNYNPKWLALIVSVIISYVAALFTKNDGSIGVYIIALLNGFLIYASATGVNQVIGKNEHKESEEVTTVTPSRLPRPSRKRTFTTKWHS